MYTSEINYNLLVMSETLKLLIVWWSLDGCYKLCFQTCDEWISSTKPSLPTRMLTNLESPDHWGHVNWLLFLIGHLCINANLMTKTAKERFWEAVSSFLRIEMKVLHCWDRAPWQINCYVMYHERGIDWNHITTACPHLAMNRYPYYLDKCKRFHGKSKMS